MEKENSYEKELDEMLEKISNVEGVDMPMPPDAANVVISEFSARMLARILDRLDLLIEKLGD